MDAVQRSADGTTCPELVVGILSTQSCPKDLLVTEYPKDTAHTKLLQKTSTHNFTSMALIIDFCRHQGYYTMDF